jgi:hypothetical protein
MWLSRSTVRLAVAASAFGAVLATSSPAAVVGYYEMCDEQGAAYEVAPILAAGHSPVLLTDLGPADLAGIDVLFVTNCDNGGYDAEYLSRLASIQSAVAAGMVLVIHDRFVDAAESILPGGLGFTILRDFADGSNVDVVDNTTLVTNGPGGLVTNSTLDGGNFSSHGFAVAASLPGNARLILSRTNPSEIVTFSYPFGAGAVVYSSIPLDFYLDTGSLPGIGQVYAPNVIAYAATLANAAQCPAGVCDDGVDCTIDVCLSSAGGVFDCAHFPNHSACFDGNPCTDDVCDSASGCFNVVDDGNSCDVGGDPCTVGQQCSGGVCTGGVPRICDDFNPCTDDLCSSVFGCFTVPNNDPCNDFNPCTSNDVCQSFGFCQGTLNTDPCEDGNQCTVGDHCQFGFCNPGTQRDCDDHSPCTADSCSFFDGCVHTPLPGQCNDLNPCTTDDVCRDGLCVGDARNCFDNDPCTVDSCSSAGGAFLCQHEDCNDVPGSSCPAQCKPVFCGNGRIDAGETCDPPDATPQPGRPGQVTCRLDCTSCGDAVKQTSDGETCDDGNFVTGCDPQHPTQPLDACQTSCTPPICQDPAKIRYVNGVGILDVHGRIEPVAPATALDPAAATFVVELTDGAGAVVFRSSLEAGVIVPRGAGFKYVDRGAKLAGGISRLKFAPRGPSVRVTLTAYGDLLAATGQMTTHLYIGTQEWTLQGQWLPTKSGWRLDPRSALGAP